MHRSGPLLLTFEGPVKGYGGQNCPKMEVGGNFDSLCRVKESIIMVQ